MSGIGCFDERSCLLSVSKTTEPSENIKVFLSGQNMATHILTAQFVTQRRLFQAPLGFTIQTGGMLCK